MRRRWLARTTLAVALGVVIWALLSLSQEAAADNDGPAVKISATQVPTECDHGGPYRDQDVWIFVGAGGTSFESASFAGDSGRVEVLTAAEHAYDLAGHSVTWLSAPAGWSLTDVKPVSLTVAGACPAADAGSTPQPANDLAKAKTEPGVKHQPADVAPDAGPVQLPQTGQDVTAMVALGLALIVTGILLLFVRRKRPSPPREVSRRDHRLVWTYPE